MKAENRIQVLFAIFALSCSFPCAVLAYGEDFKSYRDIKLTPDGLVDGSLRADAEEVATLLNVKPLLLQIRAAKQSGNGGEAPHAIQQARMICLLRLYLVSQEVRKAVALIDNELSTSNTALDSLSAQRYMASNLLNTTNFMQGGSAGTVKQSISFIGGAPVAARQEIAMASFGTSIALSLTNLLLPRIWSRKVDTPPNSLSQVFDDKSKPDDASQSYLWKFLNSPVPGNGSLPRRTILLKHWESLAGIDPTDVDIHRRLGALPEEGTVEHENIRILNKRISLLHDLKTHIEEFDGSLFEFHQAITMN